MVSCLWDSRNSLFSSVGVILELGATSKYVY